MSPIKVPICTSCSVGRHNRTKIFIRRVNVDFLLFSKIRIVNFVMTLLCCSSATWITLFFSNNRALFSRSQRVVFWIVRRLTDDSSSAQSHGWQVLFVRIWRLILAIQSQTKVFTRSGLIPRLRNPIRKNLTLLIMLFQDLWATDSALAKVLSVKYIND